MPSKEDLCIVGSPKSSSTQDLFTRELDDLVLEIKENLRLKARPNHGSANSKSRLRASPYSVPSRTDCKCACCDSRRCHRKSSNNITRRGSDDPYEALQELLKDGDLIKEAVRRLQMELTPKQRCACYDSDEEFRTPPFPFADMEI